MFTTRATYQRQRGMDDSTMVITTPELPGRAADYMNANGYVSEDGERWTFTIRQEGDRLLVVWHPKDGRPAYGPAALVFGEPIEVGGFIDRIDAGNSDPYEYRIDYLGPSPA